MDCCYSYGDPALFKRSKRPEQAVTFYVAEDQTGPVYPSANPLPIDDPLVPPGSKIALTRLRTLFADSTRGIIAPRSGLYRITGQLITDDISLYKLAFVVIRNGEVIPIQVNNLVDADQFTFSFQLGMARGDEFAIYTPYPSTLLGGQQTMNITDSNSSITAPSSLIQFQYEGKVESSRRNTNFDAARYNGNLFNLV